MGQPPTQPALVLPTTEATRMPAASAFADIVSEFASYVFGLLHRLGVPPADVPDVAQEVFLTVHSERAAFEGRSTLRTWICGISVRKAAQHRRQSARHVRRVRAFAVETPAVDPTPEPDAQLESSRRLEVLRQALDQLTDKERSVFVLYELEELSMQEVAAALGCPRFTAYTRLHAARKRLRKLLGSAYAELEP